MIYLLELSHVKDSERIITTIPFQTDSDVPFLFNEYYRNFNPEQEKFLENFYPPYYGISYRMKLPGFALKISKERLLTF